MLTVKPNPMYLDRIMIVILVIVFGFSSILFLDTFPKVWMDEAGDSTTTYTFQKDGTFRFLPLVSDSMGNQDVHFLQPRIVPDLVRAPFFFILGVGSFQGRLASVFMGILAVIGMYLLARKIGGVAFASICTLFLIFDNVFFVVARTIRPEIYVTAIAIWVLYLIIGAGTGFWKLFLCGLILGISIYTHPNSVLVCVGVLIIALSQVKFKQYLQVIIPLGLGVFIGFLPYAIYVVVQDGANQFRDFWNQIGYAAGAVTNPGNYFSGALAAEFERYISYIYFPYRLPIFLIQLLAIGYAFYKWADKFNRSFLIFIFVHVVLFLLLISAKYSRYLAVLMPVVVIFVIRMVWELAGWSYDIALPAILASVRKLDRNLVTPASLALILFANQAGGDFWAVLKSRDCSFTPFISQARSLVPPGAKVWGSMFMWFGFYDYPYRTEKTIVNYAEMNKYQPDYVILYDSEIWGAERGTTKRYDPYYDEMKPVRDMLTQLVQSSGTSVGSVPNSCYGNIEIFKLVWE
jgi:hypothetical protein